jgi:phosphoribosylaminoimidazole-succinocarboxamide synthase
MMKKIPKKVRLNETSHYLIKRGFELKHQGKVRDTFCINGKELLVVATDRISIFDFVLNALIPKKGEVLTALTHFWFSKILDFDNHLLKSEINPSFNRAYDLKKKKLKRLNLKRGLLVRNMSADLWPFEMIFRHYIGGSVFKKYQKTGMAAGHRLEPDLPKWSKLTKPLFTPSTKEEIGHDINVDADYFYAEMKKMGHGKEAISVVKNLAEAYAMAHEYAEKKGILILDTKLEVAGPTIVDEIFTPDSSRFVLKEDWRKSMIESRDPYFYDKQLVRNWGEELGVNELDPGNPGHLKLVHMLKMPNRIIEETSYNYLRIFEMITGYPLEEFQRKEMGC